MGTQYTKCAEPLLELQGEAQAVNNFASKLQEVLGADAEYKETTVPDHPATD